MTEKSRPVVKKKKRHMFNFIVNAVDKVFSQVYDGEPVKQIRRHRADSVEHILEEEVLFCKNNVCVHTKGDDKDNDKHNPGYLCLKKIYAADSEISDLVLSWVPNLLLTAGSTEEAELSEQVSKKSDEANYSEQDCKEKRSSDKEITDVSPIQNISEQSISDELLKNDFTEPSKPSSPSKALLDFETPLGDVFSINLINMKTVKLFFTEKGKSYGQFVIGSPENEYKVFHFHTAGLVKLTEIFNSWKGCSTDPELDGDEMGQQVYYINTGKTLIGENGRDLHPEEGRYRPMNMTSWHTCVNQLGQIEDGFNFRKHVFFGGLSQEVRPDAWKFLLYLYPIHSTKKERDIIIKEKTKGYEEIHNKRLSLCGEAYEDFWKQVQFTVDKDVVRTDRSHPYYAGQDNPNIQKMRNILLNYAIYNPDMGYTQGMSDLVAPVLSTLHSEVESFWCFVGLMEFSMFATTPTDDSMDKSLGFLRELLRIMRPEFYMHCLCQDYDLDLLFVHRWLVLCFKREFIIHEVLKIWEACWSRYQTDYFHIFVCVALVSLYSDQCLEKKMDADEILQYFTDMAMKFDGSAVLKESRALLYKFRQMNRIPCTLRGLLSTKGVWDGGISPEVECASNHRRCCFEYKKKSPQYDDEEDQNIIKNNTDTVELVKERNNDTIIPNDNIEPSHMEITENQRLADPSDDGDNHIKSISPEEIVPIDNITFFQEKPDDLESYKIQSEISSYDDTKFFHEKPGDLETNQNLKNSQNVDTSVERLVHGESETTLNNLDDELANNISKTTDTVSDLTLGKTFIPDGKFDNANIY